MRRNGFGFLILAFVLGFAIGWVVETRGDGLLDLAVQSPRMVFTGTSFEVALVATPQDGVPQSFAGAQVLITYDPRIVRLTGSRPAEYEWLLSDPFIPDGQGINIDLGDGEALAVYFGDWFHGLPVAPLALGYLEFTAVTPGTIPIMITGQHEQGVHTIVASDEGTDVTGALSDDWVRVVNNAPFKGIPVPHPYP